MSIQQLVISVLVIPFCPFHSLFLSSKIVFISMLLVFFTAAQPLQRLGPG